MVRQTVFLLVLPSRSPDASLHAKQQQIKCNNLKTMTGGTAAARELLTNYYYMVAYVVNIEP
jgi:hypothetical protein